MPRLQQLVALAVALILACSDCAAEPGRLGAVAEGNQRITILVDAFGSQANLHQDWGYSALVEYGGKRILFDTGNDSAGFEKNVRRLEVVGGLHLVTASRAEVERLSVSLRDKWNIDRVAPGHCSGEVTFAVLRTIFGVNYQYAGVGTVIDLS